MPSPVLAAWASTSTKGDSGPDAPSRVPEPANRRERPRRKAHSSQPSMWCRSRLGRPFVPPSTKACWASSQVARGARSAHPPPFGSEDVMLEKLRSLPLRQTHHPLRHGVRRLREREDGHHLARHHVVEKPHFEQLTIV